MKQEFILEGLNCPNCGARIESDAGKLTGVTAASLNLMKQTLILETENEEDFFGKVESIVHRYEPDVKVRRKQEAAQERDSPSRCSWDYILPHMWCWAMMWC